MRIGAIADDFTGATDLAGNLVESGFRTAVVPSVEGLASAPLADFDAVVVALKTRTAPVETAVRVSRDAAAALRGFGVRQLYFKYCSTFDSTDRGNIGPVLDALVSDLGERVTVAVPSFPVNGRRLFFGELFVDGVLLENSPMRRHPLTPMTDSHIPSVLARQSTADVQLIDWPTVRLGSRAVRERLEAPANGPTIYVIDAIDDADLSAIAEAASDLAVISGGSGLGLALTGPAPTPRPVEPAPSSGRRVILSGSLSVATQAQIDHHEPSMAIDTERALADSTGELDRLVGWVQQAWLESDHAPLIYARADPVPPSPSPEVGAAIETLHGHLARRLHDLGTTDFLIAGGETSGAVSLALGITFLAVGRQISPGVSWMTGTTPSGSLVNIALKSGNFGTSDIFTRSWQYLS